MTPMTKSPPRLPIVIHPSPEEVRAMLRQVAAQTTPAKP